MLIYHRKNKAHYENHFASTYFDAPVADNKIVANFSYYIGVNSPLKIPDLHSLTMRLYSLPVLTLLRTLTAPFLAILIETTLSSPVYTSTKYTPLTIT